MSKERTQFDSRIRNALDNPFLQTALDNNASRRKTARAIGYASLPEGFAGLSAKAHEIKKQVIARWDEYLAQFILTAQENGLQVHYAFDALQAQEKVIQLVQKAKAKVVVKSKTMIGEEIQINHALEKIGIKPIETDLGEYIVQLRGEPPAHIITPAVHLRREDVAKTFSEKLGMVYSTDVKKMTDLARKTLREYFLYADVGITGVNFGVAETGSICLLSNEGNARMVTTVPPLHIALMGIERLVPTLEDLVLFLRLLTRSATGQKLTNYVSLIQSPKTTGDVDGALERHIILIDNGRKRIAQTPFYEILYCIRCGACLNICPVFQELGGHAYHSPYPGPMGSVISPALFGVEAFGHLAKASSLCGACEEVCPVNIPFSKLIPEMREKYVREVKQPLLWKIMMTFYAWMVKNSIVYHAVQRGASSLQSFFPKVDNWTRWLPTPLSRWTRRRDFPSAAKIPFNARWERLTSQKKAFTITQENKYQKEDKAPFVEKVGNIDDKNTTWLRTFQEEWTALEGEFVLCSKNTCSERIMDELVKHKITHLLSWEQNYLIRNDAIFVGEIILENISRAGISVEYPHFDQKGMAYQKSIKHYAEAEAGLTGAYAAFADTGTVVIPSGKGRALCASLLPPVYFIILHEKDLFPTMTDWIANGGKSLVEEQASIVFVSGPSRTADIEMTLTIGVHGPGKVVLFCIKDEVF